MPWPPRCTTARAPAASPRPALSSPTRVDVTRLATSDPQHRVPHLAFQPGQMRDVSVLPMEQVITSYYLRLRVKDEAGVLSNVTRILADGGISINAVQ